MGIEEKLKVWLSNGAKASKNAFEKAGGAVQDFSDKSVLKLDKMKLESQKNKKISELGTIVSEMMYEGFVFSDCAQKEKLESIFAEIKDFDGKIKEKEELISSIDAKNETAEQSESAEADEKDNSDEKTETNEEN